ncbi:armadillo-type protein [Mycena sp. CBHHK59/15]|nr:armadillo-type protein [Mycena sp. CBHHK59/15]
MPKEHRKRGKKKKPEPEWQPPVQEARTREPDQDVIAPEESASPSWIIAGPKHAEDEVNPEAPFGYVDVNVKAYFRIVDVQIRDWQDTAIESEGGNEDIDPNEERRMFFVAALTEMVGKEKQLATDPDCSLILERMSYSMDDFVRRVFVDSLLAREYDVLVKHRFASHVCQTLFTVANQTVYREKRGMLPVIPESSDKGELRTLTQLVVDVCDVSEPTELFPVFASLIMDSFASHVIRALLLLLSPNAATSRETAHNVMRSKKSSAWKAKQGPLKSVFKEHGGREDAVVDAPPEMFTRAARKFVRVVRHELDGNETRALAADKVASPTLQMLLAVEADQQMTEDPDSLMDRVLVGLISHTREQSSSTPQVSDYLNTLLRDPTSSHLLETIVDRCPQPAFCSLWSIYFKGNMARIASHPVANFVLAKALERASISQLDEAYAELRNVWGKTIKSSRTGILRAAIDRAATLKASGAEISEAVFAAFQINPKEEQNMLIPCVLRLQTIQVSECPLAIPLLTCKHDRRHASDLQEPKVQGAVILQSLLRLPEPTINYLASLSMEESLAIAHHAIGSRVLDVLLESPTVPVKVKRQFVMSFIGSFHLLVDDRIGSRVGDRCWAFADTYLKEKIARSLIPQEQFLAGSYYGKFFARNLSLYLLQRRPDEWRTMQTDRSRPVAEPKVPAPSSQVLSMPAEKERKKRKRDAGGDEIEELFSATIGKKIKKAALIDSLEPDSKASSADVMEAIRTAPGEGKGYGKRNGGRS